MHYKSLCFACLTVGFSILFIGCSSTPKDDSSWFRDRDYDYRFAKEFPRTKIPSGLDENKILDYYPVPPLRNKQVGFVNGLQMPPKALPLDKTPVKLQKLGSKAWLLVRATPSQLWPRLKSYIRAEGMSITKEQGGEGLLSVKGKQGVIDFHLDQGFQRQTSELRLSLHGSAEKQTDLLTDIGRYFSGVLDQPSYSFAARGISLEPTMELKREKGWGNVLILHVSKERALASLKQSLNRVQFTLDGNVPNHPDQLAVTYFPQVTKKPGFFARLFGAKPDDLDKSQPYAGNHYRFWIQPLTAKQQKIMLLNDDGTPLGSTNENRDLILLIQRTIT